MFFRHRKIDVGLLPVARVYGRRDNDFPVSPSGAIENAAKQAANFLRQLSVTADGVGAKAGVVFGNEVFQDLIGAVERGY